MPVKNKADASGATPMMTSTERGRIHHNRRAPARVLTGGRNPLLRFDVSCFLPFHVYNAETSRPVAVILRSGKTPSGVEVRAHLRRLVRRIRARWPTTRILFRGDGHYARPEAMTWCEDNDVDYVFGLPGTKPLSRKVDETADAVRTERAVADLDGVRGFGETRYRAGSWGKERRAVARIEATRLGLDIRFVVTNLDHGSAEWLYQTLYCARGQAENLIKLHKAQLASDRTSCRSACANQVRLVLHTAAFWLMLAVRNAIPKSCDLAKAEFATLRLKLIKIARPRRRNGKPRPPGLRRGMSERRSLRLSARRDHAARSLNDGACAPARQVLSLKRVRKVPVSSR